MNPFLTCSSLPHPLHRSAIRSPHRQPHRRWIWAIYAALKPSKLLRELGQSDGGYVYLDHFKLLEPSVAASVDEMLMRNGLRTLYDQHPECENHVYFHPELRALVIDDPQMRFYLNQTSQSQLIRLVG